MRRINITIEIEDSNELEYALELELKETFGSSIISYTRLPDDKQLYLNDNKYRECCMKVKAANRAKYEYFDKNRPDEKR